MLFFLVSFFTFLLGKTVILFIIGDNWKDGYSDDVIITTLNLLITSLLCIIIGSQIYQVLNKRKEEYSTITNSDSKIDIVRKLSGILFYITYICLILTTLEKIMLVRTNGYAFLYSNYNSSLPSIVHKISIISKCLLFIYLATFPNKRKTSIAILFYVVYLIFTLLTGERGEIVTGLFTIFIYLFYRQHKVKDIEIFTRNKIILVFIISIIMIIVLGVFTEIRAGVQIEKINPLEEIIDFFKSQGGSIRVIEHSVQNRDQLKNYNSNYTLGIIINYFNPKERSMDEEIFEGNNLGTTITWLIEPTYYYSGGGFGTQYIAELYLDYGFIGVCIYNIALGYLLMSMINFKKYNWIIFTISLLMMKTLLFLPRDFCFSFITASILSVTNIITIIATIIISELLYNKTKKKNLILLEQNKVMNLIEGEKDENIMDS